MNMGPDAAAIDDGEAAMKAWMEGKDHKSLPDVVWDAPEDCPLWKSGLSIAQARSIWAKANRGVYS